MKCRTFIIFIFAVSLLLSSVAYAIPPEFGEFLESTADAILKFFSELSRRLTFLGMIWGKIDVMKDEIYDNLHVYLLEEIPLRDPMIIDIGGYFVKVLEPFYIAAIVLTGIYLMFFSGSPRGRSRAKSMMLRLLVGMVIISLSLHIMQLLLDVSQVLTRGILSQGPLDIGITYKNAIDYLNYRTVDFIWIDIAISIPFLIFTFILTLGIFAILVARYILLIFLIIFFPFAIFLSLFYLTKNIGKIIIKQLLFWIFLPVGYALALVIIAVGSQILTTLIPEISDLVNISGALLLIISPLIIFGLMNWFGAFAVISVIFIESLAPMIVFFEKPEIEPEKKEEEKPEEEPRAAVGVRGYERVVEKGELSREEIGSTLKKMANIRGEISLEEIQKNERLHNSLIRVAGEKRMSVEEFVNIQYGFKITSKKGVRAGVPYIKPGVTKRVKPREEKIPSHAPIRPIRATLKDTLRGMANIKGEIPIEKIQRNENLYELLVKAARERKTSIEKYVGDEYGFRVVSEEKAKPYMMDEIRSRAPSEVPRKRRKGIVTATLPQKPIPPSLTVNVQPGETRSVEIALRNDEDHSFSRVIVYDEELLTAGIFINYKENRFRLERGEEKIIKMVITTKEDIERRLYKGIIVFNTEEGSRSIIDVRIDTRERKEEEFGRDND